MYGPLTPYLLAWTGRLFAFSSFWYLFANWIPAIAAAWLLLECGRRCLPVLANLALLTLLFGLVLFVPGAGHLVLPYYAGVVQALALGLGAVLLIPDPARGGVARPWAAGVLAGLAFACKPEIGVAALAGLLAAALAGVARPVAWASRIVAGFGAIAAAVFAFAISCAPVSSLRRDSHLWPLNATPPPALNGLFRAVAGVADPQWPLIVRSAAFRLLLLVAEVSALALLLGRERIGRRWRPLAVLSGLLIVWFCIEGRILRYPSSSICLSMVAAFTVAGIALLRRDTPGRPLVVALGVFGGLAGSRAAVSDMISGSYAAPAHFVEMATWMILLCLLLPTMLTGGGPPQLWARGLFAVVAIVAAWPYAWSAIEALPAREHVRWETRRGSVFLDERDARLFGLLESAIQPGDTVLVLPEISAVDVLFDARSVSPFLHLMPGWLDTPAERALIARFDAAPPKEIVLFERPTAEYGIGPFGEGFGVLLWDWCLRRYDVAARTAGGAVLRPRRL